MTLDKAIEIVNREIHRHPDSNVIFDIFGGEPFLEFEMVKSLCEHTWKKYPDRDVKFSSITNGTLIDGNVEKWLWKNRHHFSCYISLDGTPEMHSKNRTIRYDEHTARLFGKIWPHATAKMTITKDTLPDVFEGILYISSLGINVAPSLARGIDWDREDLVIYKQQLEQILTYYINHSELRPIDLFLERLAPILIPNMQENYCGAGHSMCAYSPNGDKYPCHMFVPISLDEDRWSEVRDIDVRADNLFYSDKDCIECPIHNLCKKCPGLNFKDRGNLGLRDKRLCDFLKAEYETIAMYKVNTLCRKPISKITKFDYVELKASVRLLELLR